MNRYFKIISNDQKFSKMLSLELAEIGLIDVNENFPDSNKADRFILADLDYCNYSDVEKYAETALVIGFTKSQDTENPLCTAIFKRPFLIADLLTVFGEKQKVGTYGKHRETIKRQHYLNVDSNDFAALWGDTKISLSENEYKVLKELCEHRGEIVEREKIYDILGVTGGNMGDVYICHLRRKIDNKLGLKLIYTVRGKGYTLKN